MKLLELFCGTKSVSKVFDKRGHDTYTVDYNAELEPDLCIDIMNLTADMIIEKFGRPDVIWASPDCTSYSIAAISHHRYKEEDGNLAPKSDYAKYCDKVNKHVMELIKELNPTYYFIENPRGGMRKMRFIQDKPRYTVWYCLSGDTKVITKQGSYPIKDLSGKTVTLLTSNGDWIDAPIRNYGKQKLMKITLSRAGRKKNIHATSNHKWLVGNKEVETKDLKHGQKLQYAKLIPVKDLRIINEYVARGFTFGDGWNLKTKPKGFAMFCNEKQELLPYFNNIGGKRWINDTKTCSVIKLYGTPLDWKTNSPSVDDDPSKIFSWLAGYIAADGTVHKSNGQVTISSSHLENLETVRTLCRIIGIDTYSIIKYMRKGYGKVETPLYQVTLMRSDIPKSMLLRKKHIENFKKAGVPKHQPRKWSVVNIEETNIFDYVYCAEVPDTHVFALDDGILTHNCQYGDIRAKPTDIWTNHPNPQFKPVCHNGNKDCHHESAPRGSRTGTQGLKDAMERGVIPEQLCEHICDICTN